MKMVAVTTTRADGSRRQRFIVVEGGDGVARKVEVFTVGEALAQMDAEIKKDAAVETARYAFKRFKRLHKHE